MSMYNVKAIEPAKTVLETWPELHRLPSWKSYRKRDPDKVFRYTILMYSMQSNLHRDYPQLNDRREKATHIAGFSRNKNGEYPDYVKSLRAWDDQETREIFLDFIKHQNEPKWAQLVTLENMFWENLMHMNAPLGSSTKNKKGETVNIADDQRLKALELKAKLTDQNDKILESIDNLKLQLFRDDEDAIHAFRRHAVNSPEKFAKRHDLQIVE